MRLSGGSRHVARLELVLKRAESRPVNGLTSESVLLQQPAKPLMAGSLYAIIQIGKLGLETTDLIRFLGPL
jgi:hypothetical protein